MSELTLRAVLVFLRELSPQDLKAVVDDGVVQIPFRDGPLVKLDPRVAHAEIDGGAAHTGKLPESPFIAARAGGTVHAVNAERGGAKCGFTLARASR
jgi:hypothetical protein